MSRPTWVAVVSLVMAGVMSVRAAGHDMDVHMKMTELRTKQPGDQARADAIVTAARGAAAKYKDYEVALADGYEIFMPNQKQGVYHFVSETLTDGPMDAARPSSLLYEKAGDGWKLVGVMYTAPVGATVAELNARVPLSVGQWHEHVNLCFPVNGGGKDWLLFDKQFGLGGSLATATACRAAGGRFIPHLGGWMVHVYTSETDPAKVWASGMGDEHLMRQGGMKM